MFPTTPSHRSHRYYFSTVLLGSLFMLAACGNDEKPVAPFTTKPVESQCTDGVDNDMDGKSDCEDADCQSPGGDCVAAPALDRTVATTVGESAAFLYSGENPLQKDADPKAFDPNRVAMLKGRVIDASGEPLSGAKVSIVGHKEYGYTLSRSDGAYDLVVNGGSRMLLSFELDGHLSAQRAATPGWQRRHYLGDVGLTGSSGVVSNVPTDSDSSQVLEGPSVSDTYGEREPLVIFQPGTVAKAVLDDGTKETLPSLTVTVTEYPLDGAQQYLPGSPQVTGLAYGLDFSVAEAGKLGASHVEFSEPVSIYVENFLELPVGTTLPLGYYDPHKGQWEQGQNGQVIEILEVADGKAIIDINGDGVVEDSASLEMIGITESDLERLAARYKAGTQLMQGKVSHFSAYKAQVNVKAPKGAVAPNANSLRAIIDRPTRRGNLLVEPRALVEELPITGTPYSLTYQSNRTTAYETGMTLELPLIQGIVPPGLKRATAQVAIAGQIFSAKFDAKANQVYTVSWDGFDAQGRLQQGPQRAEVFVSYVYDGVLPNGTKPSKPIEVTLGQKIELQVGQWDFKGFELGGFGLDVLHSYHPDLRTIFYGYGDQRSADNVALVTKSASQSKTFALGTPDSVFVLSDGSAIVTDDQQNSATALGRVLKIASDGTPSVIAGPGATGTAAAIQLGQPQGIVVLDDGSLVIADIMKNALRHIDQYGTMTTLVSGVAADKPLVTHTFTKIDGLALGTRQELYIVDSDRILKYEAGTLTTFAGGGTDLSDGIDALTAQITRPSGVAVSSSGVVYLSDRDGNRIRAVLADGSITSIAGKGTVGFSGDGGNAVEAELSGPRGLTIGPDDSVYVVDQGNNRIRRVTPDGLIQTVIGGGTAAMVDGLLSTNVALNEPDGIAMAPDGTLFVATKDNVLRVSPGLPELNEKDTLVPSDDGRTLYRFDHRGKHLATMDAMTGVTELEFGYDTDGFLASITDESGLQTTIQRNAEHHPTSIVGPYGQTTQIDLSTDGWFAKVTDPIARSYELTWNAKDGLLDKVIDPTKKAATFTYDATGRLESITSPTGYSETVTPLAGTSGSSGVSVKTKGGKVTEYTHKPLASGAVQRTVKLPDSRQLDQFESSTSRSGKSPDGTQFLTYLVPDTGFGAQSMIPSESTVTLPSGKSLTTSYLRTKKVTDISNPLGVEDWREESDSNGRVASVEYHRSDRTLSSTSPMGRTSTTTLDEAGRPLKIVAKGMPVVELAYDSDGRVTSITKTANGKTRTEVRGYGQDGWISSTKDPIGNLVAYDWDLVGRPETLTRPDSKTITWGFDEADNVKSLTTPSNKLHLFDYDANTRLLTAATPPTIAASGINGLTAGQKTYAYGLDHELTGITLSDGRGIAFTYTNGGQLQSQKLASATLTFGYTKGQLTSVNRTDGVKVEMTYDGALPTGSTWSGAISGSVKADYDTNLWLKSITVNNASTVSYSYDDDGLIISASSAAGAMSITRDADTGLVTGTSLGTITSTNQFSGFAELSELSYANAGVELFGEFMTRDDLGRITATTERFGTTTHTIGFTYDSLGRLTDATRDGVKTTYTYDSNGNRLSSQTGKDAAVSATYDAQDRILTFGTQAYVHSPAGNLESRTDGTQSLALTYDELGNLTKVIATDGASPKTIEYVVNGIGRRVARKVNGVFDRAWLYRDGLRPVSEVDAAGTFTHFVYADSQSGAPDFLIRSGVLYRVVKDHLGSVRMVVNASTGVVAQTLEYDAFGSVLANSNPDFQPFGFAGGLYDAATGLVRFGARDYDPGMGRWTNKDPIGFAGGDTNVYVYVGNDPVNLVDPQGKYPVAAVVVVGLGILLATSDEEATIAAIAGLASIGIGPAFKFLGSLMRPASAPAGRTIRLATIRPGVSGTTDKFGNIKIARGLSAAERSETIRHELVHRFFSPQAGTAFAEERAGFGMWAYGKSSLVKYTEEAIAEGIAKGSIRAGLVYPITAGYVTTGGVCLEGGIYFGTIGSALYLGATQ